MKKLLLTLLAITCTIISTFTLFACGENTPKHEHVYVYKYNATEHWQECDNSDCPNPKRNTAPHAYENGFCVCGKAEPKSEQPTHEHTYSSEYTKTSTQHYYSATCEHKTEKKGIGNHDTNGTNGSCSVCGYIPTTTHTHTYSTVWTQTPTEHYYSATCEHKDEKKNVEDHDANGTNGSCSVCGYTPPITHKHTYSTVWTQTPTEHYYSATCEHTSEKKNVEDHDTKGSNGTCSVCGYAQNATHTHTYSTILTKTETQHYYSATCEHISEKKEVAEHVFTSNNTCSICGYEKIVAVESISLNKTQLEIEIDATQTLVATISPENATNKNITWQSTNAAVAEVVNGVVTAKSLGTATITATTENGKSATCEVTIKELPFVFTSYNNNYALKEYTGSNPIVTVPATYKGKAVIAIGPYSNSRFAYNTVVTHVTLPNSIVEINRGAFAYCTNLKSITIPKCAKVGMEAFIGCSSLTELALPDNCITIERSILKGCISLQKLTLLTMTDVILDYYFSNSFNNSSVPKSLKEVVITGGDRICGGAFYNCSSLTSITIPDSVTSIGSSAFYSCSSLTSISIPDSVTSIGSSAFGGCSKLEIITIPFVGGSIKTASDTYQYPFGYIFGTSEFSGGTATNQCYYGDSTSTITSTTYYIPTTLKSVTVTGGNILYGAFYHCSSLTSIIIPDSVTTIGEYAFGGCTSLTSIIIPDSVTTIGEYAFVRCTSLTSITIGNSVTTIGDYAFYSCSSLTSITIGNSVTTIGDYAFYSCSSLTSITIGNSVTTIGDYAFWDCSSLTSITIGNSVTSIGFYAFYDCYKLSTINYTSDIKDWCKIYGLDNLTRYGTWGKKLYINNVELTDIVIPDGVRSIPSYAFYSCSLTSVKIPYSVRTIGSCAFYSTGLMIIYCEDREKKFDWDSNWTYSDCPIVWDCKNSDTIYIVLNRIRYALKDGEATVVQQQPKAMGDRIEICKTITCKNNTYSVTSIGDYAFWDCSSLTSVTIPNSVSTIDPYAFSGCSSLTSITFQGTIAQWDAITKYSYWNYNTGYYIIHCTNGNIRK